MSWAQASGILEPREDQAPNLTETAQRRAPTRRQADEEDLVPSECMDPCLLCLRTSGQPCAARGLPPLSSSSSELE